MRIKNLVAKARCLLLAGVVCAGFAACSDDDHNSGLPTPEPAAGGYCLMFYASGGDPEHDLSFMTAISQAAQVTAGRPDVAVTCLFKASGEGEGEAHNGIRRYTGEDGALVQDDSFSPGADFKITDPSHLTDFICWSAGQYPGRNYLLVLTGHGRTFTPEYDLPAAGTRTTIWDDGEDMTTTGGHRASAKRAYTSVP